MQINTIHNGDCLEVLKTLPDNSIDAIITDPPYELGFMGKSWDNTGIANNVDLWKECFRVLKSGGHLLAFSGTRTYHRMAVAIEDAGFEVRDMIEWVYGSGFPKSLNIGKAVDKLQCNERQVVRERSGAMNNADNSQAQSFTKGDVGFKTHFIETKGTSAWEGWGTALKPAHEPICMARKPLSEKTVAENCLKWGTGGINIDECRVGTEELTYQKVSSMGKTGEFSGQGLTRENGGLVVTGEQTVFGRFPANLIHDGSDEVKECFPETKSGKMGKQHTRHTDGSPNGIYGKFDINHELGETYGDSGNASRFFKSIIYQAKASKRERNRGCEGLEEKNSTRQFLEGTSPEYICSDGSKRTRTLPQAQNNHPTVKPVKLIEYLINMISREGQIVLDPFAGSGTTGVACKNTNRKYILIEKEKEYIELINKRLDDVPLKIAI